MNMKIMVIKSLKYLVKTAVLIVLMLSYANAEVRESRALVVASQEAILSSELAARIENIAVKEMQRFKKGDLLIQFDCSLYEAQKDVVSANANSALIKLKSDEQMLQMRSIGKYELELSISEYEKAKSELRIAELNVERCQIKAPFDGAVEEVVDDEVHNYRQSSEDAEQEGQEERSGSSRTQQRRAWGRRSPKHKVGGWITC